MHTNLIISAPCLPLPPSLFSSREFKISSYSQSRSPSIALASDTISHGLGRKGSGSGTGLRCPEAGKRSLAVSQRETGFVVRVTAWDVAVDSLPRLPGI